MQISPNFGDITLAADGAHLDVTGISEPFQGAKLQSRSVEVRHNDVAKVTDAVGIPKWVGRVRGPFTQGDRVTAVGTETWVPDGPTPMPASQMVITWTQEVIIG
jgi:hypothetical protein